MAPVFSDVADAENGQQWAGTQCVRFDVFSNTACSYTILLQHETCCGCEWRMATVGGFSQGVSAVEVTQSASGIGATVGLKFCLKEA